MAITELVLVRDDEGSDTFEGAEKIERMHHFRASLYDPLSDIAAAIGDKALRKYDEPEVEEKPTLEDDEPTVEVLRGDGEPVAGYGFLDLGSLVGYGGKSGKAEYYLRFDSSQLETGLFDKKPKEDVRQSKEYFKGVNPDLIVYLRRSSESPVEVYFVAMKPKAEVEEVTPQAKPRWTVRGFLFGWLSSGDEKQKYGRGSKEVPALVEVRKAIEFRHLSNACSVSTAVGFRIGTITDMAQSYQPYVPLLEAKLTTG